MNNIKTLFKAIREMQRLDKRMLPCCFSLGIIGALLPFVNIWFSAKIIDTLEAGKEVRQLIIYIACAVLINFVLAFIDNYLNDMFYMYRSQMYNKEQQNIAAKLYATEYKQLEDSDFKELVHKHSEAQNRVYSAFVQFAWMVRNFVSGFVTLIVSIIILIPLFKVGFIKTGESFFERPVFLLTIFGSIFIMVGIMLVVALKMNKAYFEAGDEYSRLDRIFYYFLDMFGDYKTGKEIRLYHEQYLIKHTAVDVLLTDGEKLLKKNSMQSAKSGSMVALLGAVVGFGVYLFIGIKGLFGLFGIGSLVLYCGAFMQIVAGVMKMATTFGKTAEMCPLANYYFEILGTEDDMVYGNEELDLNSDMEVRFENVSFKYPGSENYALKDITLTVYSGEHLAVVGRNGSGKTTFIKLMCRFYDATKGNVFINNKNIKEYTKKSLMELYSVVFQDFKLFSLPLCENVSSDEKYDYDKLYSALEQSNVKERVLKMPEKERTYLYKNVDKDGIEISGGEAQKLALARALYKDSPIVILDEPTAALDPIAENEIYNRFDSFVENKTAVYISHRLSSCVFCNRIAVFDKAELVETGTHEELLGNDNGQYYKLWNAQAQYYDV